MARTLLIQKWEFHTAYSREPKRVHYPPKDIRGVDILQFIQQHLSPDGVFDFTEKKRWAQVDSVEPKGTRSLFVAASAGAYGEEGRIVDRRDSTTQFQLKPDHAPTSRTRMLIVAPDVGNHAFALIERSTGRGSAGLDLIGWTHSIWREKQKGVTWVKEWIDDADTWCASGQLKAVEIRRYSGLHNTAKEDGVATFEYRARARRGGELSKKSLDAILQKSSKAHELLGLKQEEDDRVFLELMLDGRTAKFALDGGRLPKAQAVIADNLADADFIIRCADEIEERLCPGLGFAYDPQWIT